MKLAWKINRAYHGKNQWKRVFRGLHSDRYSTEFYPFGYVLEQGVWFSTRAPPEDDVDLGQYLKRRGSEDFMDEYLKEKKS